MVNPIGSGGTHPVAAALYGKKGEPESTSRGKLLDCTRRVRLEALTLMSEIGRAHV